MESECRYRFILLDVGHPMNTNSINNILTSLENTLALVLSFSGNSREIGFGISVLNSDFTIFESKSHLQRNYGWIMRNLKASLTATKHNNRVTVQEYKYLLSSSTEGVIQEFQNFIKARNLSSQLPSSLIEIAVVTKKTASVLADLLMDVTNKLQKTFPNLPSVKNYKIIHLGKQENISLSSDKNMLIDWTSCSDNVYCLNCFFQGWLLNQQQQLKILLSKEPNLEVHCDVDDCIINPGSIFDGRFYLSNDISHKSSRTSSGVSKPYCELEVINRLPMNGFCPTLVFGIPRRVSATRSPALNWTDSQINSKIFEELCQELLQTGEGLLAKSVLPTWKEVNGFHLLTSDGNMLLMNDVAPGELYVPTSGGGGIVSKSVHSCRDESAASVIRACFEKIKRLDEYNPRHYSSGVYECLKHNLVQGGHNMSSFGQFDRGVKLFGRKSTKKEPPKPVSQVTNNTNDNSTSATRKKKQKTSPKLEADNVHPALLSDSIVEKYRKIHSQAFNLPELSTNYD